MEEWNDFQNVETRVDTGANEESQPAGSGVNRVEKNTDKLSGGVKRAAAVAGGAVAGAVGTALVMGFVVPDEAPELDAPGSESASGALPDAARFDGNQIPVADRVNDDMTFGEAFAAARGETGPGGVFFWNGKAYGTFYRDEWHQLSPEDRQTFSSHPYHQPDTAQATGDTPGAGDTEGNPIDSPDAGVEVADGPEADADDAGVEIADGPEADADDAGVEVADGPEADADDAGVEVADGPEADADDTGMEIIGGPEVDDCDGQTDPCMDDGEGQTIDVGTGTIIEDRAPDYTPDYTNDASVEDFIA